MNIEKIGNYLRQTWPLILIILTLLSWNLFTYLNQPARTINMSNSDFASLKLNKVDLQNLDHIELEGLKHAQPDDLARLRDALSGSSACFDNLDGISENDKPDYVKLEIKYKTDAPSKFRVFTLNMNDQEFRSCLPTDKWSISAYTKINRSDTLMNLNSVVRSSAGESEYTLSIKAFRVTGKKEEIGNYSRADTISEPFKTRVITDKFIIKSRDEKKPTPAVVASRRR